MTEVANLPHSILRFCAAAALLASCSGGAVSSPSSLLELGRLTTSLAARPAFTLYPDTRGSWISPDIGRAPRLLFASDAGFGKIEIFTLPDFVLKGTITGFSEPQGMCTGTGGTVWAANTNASSVVQLSRTGKRLNTIDDHYGYPVSCAVNRTNGNLAVFNIFDISAAGGAYVYSCPSCKPTVLTIPSFYYYYFGAYDAMGNLFVDGRNIRGSYTLGEIPSGSTTGHLITIVKSSGKIYFPGFLQWYAPANYMVAADQRCDDMPSACLYRVKVSGSHGTIVGTTELKNPSGGAVCDLTWGELSPVAEKSMVGGDDEYCGYASNSLDRWRYPAGSVPRKTVKFGGSNSIPGGGAISLK